MMEQHGQGGQRSPFGRKMVPWWTLMMSGDWTLDCCTDVLDLECVAVAAVESDL